MIQRQHKWYEVVYVDEMGYLLECKEKATSDNNKA